MRLFLLLFIFCQTALAQNFSSAAIQVNLLSFLDTSIMSKKELNLSNHLQSVNFVNIKSHLYNGLVKLSPKALNKINNKSFKSQAVVSNLTDFISFSVEGKGFSLFFVAFNHHGKTYYERLDSDMIQEIDYYNPKQYVNLINSLNPNFSCINQSKNVCQIKNHSVYMIYNKEIELMAQGYNKELDNGDVFGSLVFHEGMLNKQRELLSLKKTEFMLKNLSYTGTTKNRLIEDNTYNYPVIDKSQSIEDWKNDLQVKYAIPQIKTHRKVKVAMIDAGFERTEFSNVKIRDHYNEYIYNHGTHVGGILLATNPDMELLSYNAFPSEDGFVAARIGRYINKALADGAEIINISISGPNSVFWEKAAFSNAALKGVPIVIAAGNEEISLSEDNCHSYPACYKLDYDNIIVVGNLNDTTNDIHFSSNYGPLVDVYFTGTQIKSLSPHKGYRKLTGSSQSAPFITGIMSRYMGARDEKYTVKELKEIINKNTMKHFSFSKNADLNVWSSIESEISIANSPN